MTVIQNRSRPIWTPYITWKYYDNSLARGKSRGV